MHTLSIVTLVTAASAGHVSIPFSRVAHPYSVALNLQKRATGAFDLEALNNITGGGYFSELGIGTPPQKLSFALDTGSSDTWVNSVDSQLCTSEASQRLVGYCMKTFDSSNSRTFNVVDEGGFNIEYLDGRRIAGDYFNDTVTINNRTIRDQRLGLATRSLRNTGIMGLGFSSNVASTRKYPAIIDQMKAQGLIATSAFSLYLNDLESSSGNILFGGVDTKKYIGDLAKLPLVHLDQSTSENITSFAVDLASISTSGSGSPDTPGFRGQAILDSGSTLSILPDSIVEAIYDAFEVVSIENLTTPFVDCAKADDLSSFKLDFRFGDKTITVPARELVIDAFGEGGTILLDQPGTGEYFNGWSKVCMFGLSAASGYGIEFALLGDTFLRSAYVVYDMDNMSIGIAQANLNSTESSVKEFTSEQGIPPTKGVDSGNDGSGSNDDDGSGVGRIAPSLALMVALVGGMALL